MISLFISSAYSIPSNLQSGKGGKILPWSVKTCYRSSIAVLSGYSVNIQIYSPFICFPHHLQPIKSGPGQQNLQKLLSDAARDCLFPASAPVPHGIINLSYSQECLTQSGWPVISVCVRDCVFSQSGFQSMFRCVRGEREWINDKCVGDLWIIDRSLRLEVICKWCSCCYCITRDLRL